MDFDKQWNLHVISEASKFDLQVVAGGTPLGD
jgi:hypothetical protein